MIDELDAEILALLAKRRKYCRVIGYTRELQKTEARLMELLRKKAMLSFIAGFLLILWTSNEGG